MISNIVSLSSVKSVIALAVRIGVTNQILLRMRLIKVFIILAVVKHGLGLLPLISIVKFIGIVIIRICVWIKLIFLLVSPCVTLIGICVKRFLVSKRRRVRSVDIVMLFDI
jgi:hypothetical protein